MSGTIKYSVKNNLLRIESPVIEVPFEWPIAEVIAFCEVLVIRLEPDPGTCFNENVYGVGGDGSIIWRIEKRKHIYDDSPYTSIILKDGKVKIFNWDGDELIVNPKNGDIISVGYGK